METILFEDRSNGLVITNEVLKIGDCVVPLDQISPYVTYGSINDFKEYLTAIGVFILGIVLLMTFSWWSLLGAILLLYPYGVFFGSRSILCILLESGGSVENSVVCKRKDAKAFCFHLRDAIKTYHSAPAQDQIQSEETESSEDDSTDDRSLHDMIRETESMMPEEILKLIEESNWQNRCKAIFIAENLPDDASEDIADGVHLVLLGVGSLQEMIVDRLAEIHDIPTDVGERVAHQVELQIFNPLTEKLKELDDDEDN